MGDRRGRHGGHPVTVRPPLARDELITWVRREGEQRYHDHHRYHALMHEGRLTKLQLQQWVLNRYYYQTRIPIKDAVILSKSEDPVFRRMWIRRIRDHDGDETGGEAGGPPPPRPAAGGGRPPPGGAGCRGLPPRRPLPRGAAARAR